MGLADVNNDIKVLFFIINSLIGVVPGIFLFGVGVSAGVVYQAEAGIAAFYVVVGLVIIGLAALGFAGAIRENRIMLYVWSAIMALIAIASVIVYDVVSPSPNQTYLQLYNQYDQSGRSQDRFEIYRRAQEYANTQIKLLAPTITYFVLVFVGVALAIRLALQARNQVNNQGVVFRPPPTSYSPGV